MKKNCRSSWLFTNNYTEMHGQQNIKIHVKYRRSSLKTECFYLHKMLHFFLHPVCAVRSTVLHSTVFKTPAAIKRKIIKTKQIQTCYSLRSNTKQIICITQTLRF